MYFCPCPCTDPHDPETEENSFISLPRNLSYVQDSFLDPYSLSSRFVHNPKIDRLFRNKSQNNSASSTAAAAAAAAASSSDSAEGEDEHSSLLSVVKAHDFPLNCGPEFLNHVNGCNHNTTPSLPPSSPPCYSCSCNSSTITGQQLSPPTATTTATHFASSPQSSSHAATGSLVSTLQSQLRLAELLSSPPRDLSPPHRVDLDLGSSVDGEEQLEELNGGGSEIPCSAILRSPDHKATVIDRGEDLSETYLIKVCQCPNHPQGVGFADLQEFEAVPDMDRSEGPSGQESVSVLEEELKSSHSMSVYGSNPLSSSNSYESPDSDGFSEEGVFVNMADDLDSNHDKSTTISDVSDDTCVSADSMFLSPDEEELTEGEPTKPVRKMSLEEAINRAASDLNRMGMTMYPKLMDSTSDRKQQQSEERGEENGVAGGAEKEATTASHVPPANQLRQSFAHKKAAGSDLNLTLATENCEPHVDPPSPPSPTPCLSESPLFDDHEFNFSKVKLRKSSSLKTNKTPPGTPYRKKAVRFADAMGLDLESVRHVLNMESPPRIPASAMADLHTGLGDERKAVGTRFLTACFQQPGANENFVHRVNSQKVCLENAIITDLAITGFVRVANVSFHKSVRVRYTHNDWATFHDIAAAYVANSCDGPTDRFSFCIVAPAHFVTGNRLQFAVSYNAEGTEYWDNNEGANYSFECFGKTVPTENESAWMHFL